MTDNGFAKEGRSHRTKKVSLTKDKKNSCTLDGLTNPNTYNNLSNPVSGKAAIPARVGL